MRPQEPVERMAGGQVVAGGDGQKFTVRREELLWNWPMLLLFVGLITLEWILRKFSNLS